MDRRQPPEKQTKRSTRFNRTLCLSLLLIGACWGFLYAFLGHYSEADKLLYDKMVNRESEEKFSETQVSKQERKGLQKSFFIDLGKGQQEINVQSARSELALEKTGRHVEIVEHLYDMTARMQESRYFVLSDGHQVNSPPAEDDANVVKEQVIIQVHAQEAIYHYKDGQFTAENFIFRKYIVPNHHASGDIQQGKLIAEGKVESLKAIFTNGGIQLIADGLDFKASLSQDELSQSEERIDISADHVNYQGDRLVLEGNAVVLHGKSILSAHLIALTTLSNQPFKIKNMIADGNVELKNYNGMNTASDRAVFVCSEIESEVENRCPQGTFTLSMYTTEQDCHITDKEGDEIWANSVVINTVTQNALFNGSHGTLQPSGQSSREISFSSDKMDWNEKSMRLTLSGNVKLNDPAIGKLWAANDVSIVLNKADGKKILKGVETEGEAILSYSDQEAFKYILKSYGSFRVNHQTGEVKLLSPVNPDGSVPKGKQVYFEDAKGIIHADKVFVKYQESKERNKKIVPERIVLKDHVKIANTFDPASKEKAMLNQYIVADRVDFIPLTHQMILKASKGNRVLFFDKENNLEVSASGLEIYRDKAVNKDSIRGIGDIRFNFVEDELKQFSRFFLIKSGK